MIRINCLTIKNNNEFLKDNCLWDPVYESRYSANCFPILSGREWTNKMKWLECYIKSVWNKRKSIVYICNIIRMYASDDAKYCFSSSIM